MPFVSFRKLVRTALRKTPYEISRRLPPANLELGALGLALAEQRRPALRLLQVGACDGREGDPLHTRLLAGDIRAVVVEPVPDSFDRLSRVYADSPNVKPLRAAVSKRDGVATIHRVRNEGRWKDSIHAPLWASFDPTHLVKLGVSHDEIEAVEVPALSLQTIVREQMEEEVDFLMVDTEGFDAEVVRMALELESPPLAICFEYVHLGDADRRSLFESLGRAGYRWAHDAMNTLALGGEFRDLLIGSGEDKER